ncbi:MAG: prolyl oligopeptidase family serine peptidase [Xanthomonadales bacterium]|nr:prolyl oligopeptidase family serine peptidase [Xanthomonadales bacterium]
MLLVHGRDDTVVPFRQSKIMYKAMKKAGKDVELVDLDGEDHWLSTSETRLHALEEIDKFLMVQNPPN